MNRRRDRGVVLALVLILALLLSAALSTFIRRAVIDTTIINNRNAVAQAEALARGGIRIATGVVYASEVEEALTGIARLQGQGEADDELLAGNTLLDDWASLGEAELVSPDGGRLRINVRDTGSLLNLNAVVPRKVKKEGQLTPADIAAQTADEGQANRDAEEFLVDLLSKVIDEMAIAPGEKNYDPRELGQNLIDYLDDDTERIRGGREDDYYLSQDPPYESANRPLLSVDEIGLIEGFDQPLLESLRSYVTVYPLYGAEGVNLNTAPPHVLATVYHGSSGDRRLIDEDIVRQILKLRDEDEVLCSQTAGLGDRCKDLSQVGLQGTVFPPTKLPSQTTTYEIRSEATVKDIRRTLEAVVSVKPGEPLQVLSWRIR